MNCSTTDRIANDCILSRIVQLRKSEVWDIQENVKQFYLTWESFATLVRHTHLLSQLRSYCEKLSICNSQFPAVGTKRKKKNSTKKSQNQTNKKQNQTKPASVVPLVKKPVELAKWHCSNYLNMENSKNLSEKLGCAEANEVLKQNNYLVTALFVTDKWILQLKRQINIYGNCSLIFHNSSNTHIPH